MTTQDKTTFVVQLMCPRDLTAIQFTLYAEDFGPGYGLVAGMTLKHSVFEKFAELLDAEVREDLDPARRWQRHQHRIGGESK